MTGPIYITQIAVFSGLLSHSGVGFAAAPPNAGWVSQLDYDHKLDDDNFTFSGERDGYAAISYYDGSGRHYSKIVRNEE